MSLSPFEPLTELVDTIRFLHGKGWTPATSSNFSVRRAADSFLVSESGRDKGSFDETTFLEVSLRGLPAPHETRRPSAETRLHAVVYERFAEATCVLHTHSVAATALSLLAERRGALRLRGFEVLKGLRGITTHEAQVILPVFPNTQDMEWLGREVANWLDAERAAQRQSWGYLIAGHGTYAWGSTVAEAKRHLEVFEFLFECVLTLCQTSRPTTDFDTEQPSWQF